MMNQSNDRIQYIFARLATHSNLVAKIINNFSEIFNYFSLSHDEESLLKKFFTFQGDKLLSAALIMEEKRKRELISVLKFLPIVLSDQQLQSYWQGFLETISEIECIPHSVGDESKKFLQYLLSEVSDQILIAIIEYELLINQISLQKYYPIQCSMDDDYPSARHYLSYYQVSINPNLIIKSFSYPISKIIFRIKDEQRINISQLIYEPEKEVIACIKNYDLNSIKVMSLNHYACELLNSLLEAKSISNLIEIFHAKTKLSEEVIFRLIKKAVNSEIVYIQSNCKH